ncbi:CBS domain-containing protein [bacterium]|nr:CBS domain-containing protein [bacterium]
MKKGDENPIVRLNDKFDLILKAMGDGQVNAVSVIDNNEDFQGLITGYDLRKAFQKYDNIKECTAKDIMVPNPVTIPAGLYAIQAFNKIKQNPKPLLLLPVLQGKKVVGIITMQHMIRAGL